MSEQATKGSRGLTWDIHERLTNVSNYKWHGICAFDEFTMNLAGMKVEEADIGIAKGELLSGKALDDSPTFGIYQNTPLRRCPL